MHSLALRSNFRGVSGQPDTTAIYIVLALRREGVLRRASATYTIMALDEGVWALGVSENIRALLRPWDCFTQDKPRALPALNGGLCNRLDMPVAFKKSTRTFYLGADKIILFSTALFDFKDEEAAIRQLPI